MRQRRLLIVGCGDVIRRALPWLAQRFLIYALVRSAEQAASLRKLGIRPILGDLDQPHTLTRLSGLAEYILHSAPPPNAGDSDPRTKRLLATLSQSAILPCRVVYISTTGIYGDCDGALIDESKGYHPESARAQRRVAAERGLRRWGRFSSHICILRAPGIYADSRLPVDRIRAGTPALRPEDDTYSNHIHADDLAHAAALALFRGRPNRSYNICDDAHWKMGDWFDKVADAYQLPRPPRMSRAEIQQHVSLALWSFMRESRRIANKRMKQELGLRLQHPSPTGLLAAIQQGQPNHP